jgi:lipopolysaccharide transport system ATP-binding protein
MSIHADPLARPLDEAFASPAGRRAAPVMIRAVDLGKQFKIYPKPWGRMTEWLTLGRARRHDDFWALRDVSFEVARGESLGVIGVNGSGKSTLLKILSGAMYPTTGTFDVRGRVLSLLELGTGVNPQLTGRQNVINSSRLLAFPPDYVTGKMDAIEAFAELGEFFDRPVRLYSSGMLVRLVFSMFACFDPEVFVVDEALSVGDLHFQQKCARRIGEMLAGGVTMLFVSHDLAAVEALCDRVMVLHGGQVRFLGDKRRGIQAYYALAGTGRQGGGGASAAARTAESAPIVHLPSVVAAAGAGTQAPTENGDVIDDEILADLPWQMPDATDAGGDGRVEITGVCYRRADGTHGQVVERGQPIEVFVRYRGRGDVGPVNGGLMIYDRLDQLLFGVGWLNAELEPLWLRDGQQAVARFRFHVDLEPGEYVVWLGAGEATPDPAGPHGWSQHVGGARFVTLPRAGKLAVLPRADGRRHSFGPANLSYTVSRAIIDDPGAAIPAEAGVARAGRADDRSQPGGPP